MSALEKTNYRDYLFSAFLVKASLESPKEDQAGNFTYSIKLSKEVMDQFIDDHKDLYPAYISPLTFGISPEGDKLALLGKPNDFNKPSDFKKFVRDKIIDNSLSVLKKPKANNFITKAVYRKLLEKELKECNLHQIIDADSIQLIPTNDRVIVDAYFKGEKKEFEVDNVYNIGVGFLKAKLSIQEQFAPELKQSPPRNRRP